MALQGPVSDREYRVLYPETAELMKHARSLSPEELMPIKTEGRSMPITAKKFLSFTAKVRR